MRTVAVFRVEQAKGKARLEAKVVVCGPACQAKGRVSMVGKERKSRHGNAGHRGSALLGHGGKEVQVPGPVDKDNVKGAIEGVHVVHGRLCAVLCGPGHGGALFVPLGVGEQAKDFAEHLVR